MADDADALLSLRIKKRERHTHTRHILLRSDQFLAISSQRVNVGGCRLLVCGMLCSPPSQGLTILSFEHVNIRLQSNCNILLQNLK
jgi:hypothetical protein